MKGSGISQTDADNTSNLLADALKNHKKSLNKK